jgi:hypothetical protein
MLPEDFQLVTVIILVTESAVLADVYAALRTEHPYFM